MDDHTQEFCETNVIHNDIVLAVREKISPEVPIYGVSELFKVFGDLTRTRIICALTIAEMCVCDIAAAFGMSSSAISHQLRILKQARIVKNRRDGKIVYYRLADEHITKIFNIAFEHVIEEEGGINYAGQ